MPEHTFSKFMHLCIKGCPERAPLLMEICVFGITLVFQV
jgi:hypothetical protein